ncbi:hypothetical protein FA15DRAFT_663874 [Coprinopsis marcescibilis]|uniref:GAR domain-containing protein n=1 Tax=Coprinopsis marcescibilis TaxID=230819 RepID=A0A5C3LCL9_COPMA|nr:hypothetical protein FA15DRAFT_663874 [Coprinopsis marcescibilis]
MSSVLSVASSSSSSSVSHYSSAASANQVPASPASIHSNLSAASSTSSLKSNSFGLDDDENATVTLGRPGGSVVGSVSSPRHSERERSPSPDGIRVLAVSTRITELQYAISDIQTRIFEIQELRHKSQSQSQPSDPSSPGGKDTNVSSIIDQSLMSLDERLGSVETGIKSVTENIQPFLDATPPAATPTTAKTITMATTPTLSSNSSWNEPQSEAVAALLRKHATLLGEWESVQDESDVLREELKEDKWLTVFRTVTDQADGMMSSLEKAVNRCQDFIFQVHHRKTSVTTEDFFSAATPGRNGSEKQPVSIDTFQSLVDSYEAKKKHYMPATSKVLAIIDRGVRDRVTKNGETLRRHSESAQRWKTLRERIARTDTELENVRKILLNADGAGSENGSSTSGTNASTSQISALATPSNGSRTKLDKAEKGSAFSRSISPFRKFARKFGNGSKNNATATTTASASVVSPLSVSKKAKAPALAATISAPPASQGLRKQRTSIFTSKPVDPITPDRPGHKYSLSATPDSSPRVLSESTMSIHQSYSGNSTFGRSRPSLSNGTHGSLSLKPTWNSSTKVLDDEKKNGIKGTPSRGGSRPPSATGMYKSFSSMTGEEIPPVPPLGNVGTPHRPRSSSRASMASSRPWSPLGSSISTSQSSSQHNQRPAPISTASSKSTQSNSLRLPSRPPSRAQTPSRSVSNANPSSLANTPKGSSRTPSHMPGPSGNFRSISTSGASDWSPGMHSPDYQNRSLSPTMSVSGMYTPGSHPPRPPSRSMIPIPSVHLSAASPGGRSTSSMSHIPGGYNRAGAESPTFRMSQFKAGARRAQTPDLMMMMSRSTSGSIRPSLPPSSFRDGNASTVSSSRPGSRAGSHTPSLSMFENGSKFSLVNGNSGEFTFEYEVANSKDPLDVEVARIVNSIPHGLVIERVDPPLKKAPRDGEEVKAQYAFSNALGRKVVTLRLTTLTRATKAGAGEGDGKPKVTMVTSKKVMCRVGGGWQDLNLYILNRQAGSL